MERERFIEMMENLKRLSDEGVLEGRDIYLFAHCGATMELADELLKMRIKPVAILDNNPAKYDLDYKGIPVCEPLSAVQEGQESRESVILIVSRFYEQMASQMRGLGFTGRIEKLTDYNTYAEYSLSPETLIRKSERLKRGIERLREIKGGHKDCFIVFCPFPALGDVYFCMSYLKQYLELIGKRCDNNSDENDDRSGDRSNDRTDDRLDVRSDGRLGDRPGSGCRGCLVCVVGNAQRQVAELFDYTDVLMLSQKDMDEAVQAVIYTGDPDCYIAHQDRPYVVDLHKALFKKCIPLETVYKCGIFGLPQDTEPVEPSKWEKFEYTEGVGDRTAIISPYAKSVASLPESLWSDMVDDLKESGYRIFTNVSGDEKPLDGTEAISPKISEMRSAVERAGLFVGIRSGMCDVIKTADWRKIALYPDYYYCDTKWKSIDMYSIDGFENIVVRDGDTWEDVKRQIKIQFKEPLEQRVMKQSGEQMQQNPPEK